MAQVYGLSGIRPAAGWAEKVTCPPYDVIRPGSPLEAFLMRNPDSMYHVILGASPNAALDRLIGIGAMMQDTQPAYYVYEQRYNGCRRVGLLGAVGVSPYEAKEIIRHEKTFDAKVGGRIALMEEIGYVAEPIWLLTEAPIDGLLEEACSAQPPMYDFVSGFGGESELCGIHNRIYRVLEGSVEGKRIQAALADKPLYIADGHHRYHSALRMGLARCIAYVCTAGQAQIQAYNRVIRGKTAFADIMDKLPLRPADGFRTPERHAFAIFAKSGCWEFKAEPPSGGSVLDRLDCQILEASLYPLLGLSHDMIMDTRHFDYYPEQDLAKMQDAVNEGRYDIAVALHPVSAEDLMAVADAGTADPDIVMPEKSTFFSPKILSGLFMIPAVKG